MCIEKWTNKTFMKLGLPPGIVGGDPCSPYPLSGGMISFRFSPMHMPLIPRSHPLMTWPFPRVKLNGLEKTNVI